MPNSTLNRLNSRIVFLSSSLLVASFCAVALKLIHAHPFSTRLVYAAGYGVAVLSVLWTRCLESRLKDAGMPRWSFWPYFLIVFTGCLGALALKLTNSLETIALFLVFQLPALLLPARAAVAESPRHGVNGVEASESAVPRKRKPARPVTPLGAIEFAVYIVLIAGLWHVLHLLRGDVAGLEMSHAFRIGLDAASTLLCVLWIFSVRGRFEAIGLIHWYPTFCSVVLAGCAMPFAIRVISFQHALIVFAVLQIPAVIVRREFIPQRFIPVEDSEELAVQS